MGGVRENVIVGILNVVHIDKCGWWLLLMWVKVDLRLSIVCKEGWRNTWCPLGSRTEAIRVPQFSTEFH